jgi:exodeoxyribonuclease-3
MKDKPINTNGSMSSFAYLQDLRKTRKKLIVVGDYNIAHKEIDIHDPKGNKKSSGFLPEERAWMDSFLQNEWVDSFRELNPDCNRRLLLVEPTFPHRTRAEQRMADRLYLCNQNLKAQLKEAKIYPDVKHSDHCPIYAAFKI